MNLLKHIDVELATTTIDGITDGTTSYSQIVDTHGFEGCLWLVFQSTEGGITKTTGILKIQGSTGNSTTAMVTYNHNLLVPGTTPAAVNYRIIGLLDSYRPEHRYQRCKLTGNSSGDITFIAIKYGGRVPGSTLYNDSSSIKSSTVIIGGTG